MILRSATPGDAHPVTALEDALFGPGGWSLQTVLIELAGVDRSAVVATEGNDVLGYAITMASGEVADLLRIGVHPSHRRRGLARALLKAVAEGARTQGAARMLLEVASLNRAALAFYVREGFVQIDRRRRYYREAGDALVLEWKL